MVLSGFNLTRFREAQDPVYERVLCELQSGKKTSHWMWFVFPQITGLGRSAMAQLYGIGSLAEAQAYVRDDVLGPRLRECTQVVIGTEARTAREIFGQPDDMKFRSSMTLFSIAVPAEPNFRLALAKYHDGRHDPATVALLTDQT